VQMQCGRNIDHTNRMYDDRNYKIYTVSGDLEAMKAAVVKTMNEAGFQM
jgi:hypothetical protein